MRAQGLTGGEQHGMLLGDPDVVVAIRHGLLQQVQAGPGVHRRGDPADALVATALSHERLPEDLRVGPRSDDVALRRRRHRPAPDDRGRLDGVPALHPDEAPVLGRLEPLALDRLDVQHHRTLGLQRRRERAAHRADVVPVDDADVGEVELLEEQARRPERLDRLLDLRAQPLDAIADAGRQPREALLELLAHLYRPGLRRTRLKQRDSAPTFGAIDMPLSLRTMTIGTSAPPACCRASNATPPVSAPSPITATTWPSGVIPRRIASLMPTAIEIDVDAWPAPMASCSDSKIEQNGASPPCLRIVLSASRRPVRILCGYAWWPTSHRTLSRGESMTLWIATASSHVPRFAPKWPPTSPIVSISSSRISWATCCSAAGVRPCRSCGPPMLPSSACGIMDSV